MMKTSTDDPLIKQLMNDPDNADLEPKERAVVDFSLKLTRTPGAMEENDVQTLREQGFSDRNILDVVLVASLFNFMDRVADGLGVEVDPAFDDMAKHYEGS